MISLSNARDNPICGVNVHARPSSRLSTRRVVGFPRSRINSDGRRFQTLLLSGADLISSPFNDLLQIHIVSNLNIQSIIN